MSTYAYNQLVTGLKQAREDIYADAREIGAQDDADAQSGIDYAAKAMAKILADDDPKFDAKHFLAAVGVLPEVEQHPNETGWTGR